ncbi:MAG: protease pro-enzyme activation domain-containing protein [Polyangiaceae bacterium]
MSEGPREFVRFVVGLTEAGAMEIRKRAMAASDPDSPRYGDYLSTAELLSYAAPDPAALAKCKAWFKSKGFTVYDKLFEIDAPQVFAAFGRVELAEKHFPGLLQDGSVVSHAEWYLPGDIAGFVKQLLVNVVTFDGDSRMQRSRKPGRGKGKGDDKASPAHEEQPTPAVKGNFAHGGVTPADIAEIYEFPAEWTGKGETIVLLATSVPSIDDLEAFWKRHGIQRALPEIVDYPGPAFTRGAAVPKVASLEVTMDVQWLGAMAPGARIIVLNIDASWASDLWSATLGWALAQGDATIMVSTFTTPAGRYYEANGRRTFTDLMGGATAKGLTVVAASGDWGVYDGRPSVGYMPPTATFKEQVCDAAWPSSVFPASQPSVLTVGGTMITHRAPLTEVGWSGLPPPDPRLQREIAMSRLASSGGFCDQMSMPPWQKSAVLERKVYSRGSNMPAVTPYGRAYPDVSLMAQGPTVMGPDGELVALGYHAIFEGTDINYAGGTSLAAPIWGAIIARWNEARRAEGLPRVGMVNPLLYKLAAEDPSVFRNIAHGSADVELKIVNSDNDVATYRIAGYEAASGWDPVTGLGVPRVGALIESQVGRIGAPAKAAGPKRRAKAKAAEVVEEAPKSEEPARSKPKAKETKQEAKPAKKRRAKAEAAS